MYVGTSDSVNADTSRSAVTIISPKRDSGVNPSHEVVGKMSIAAQPIVLVRAEVPGGEWYVQPTIGPNERGYFKSKARFGNDKTARGQRFQIAVVAARNKAELDFFNGKEFVPAIPEMMAISPTITVVLGDASAKEKRESDSKVAGTTSAGLLTHPRNNDSVASMMQVTGKVRTDEFPIVLVRNDERNEEWWVQGPIEFNKQGDFACQTRFGNEKTPDGQRFRVVVLSLPKAVAETSFSIGKAIAKLPDDVPRSDEIVVTVSRPETKK
jgi:hypothetical protein